MKAELAKAILDALGYTEQPTPCCRNCCYFIEKENLYVDWQWDGYCNILGDPLGPLPIAADGRCEYFCKSE